MIGDSSNFKKLEQFTPKRFYGHSTDLSFTTSAVYYGSFFFLFLSAILLIPSEWAELKAFLSFLISYIKVLQLMT